MGVWQVWKWGSIRVTGSLSDKLRRAICTAISTISAAHGVATLCVRTRWMGTCMLTPNQTPLPSYLRAFWRGPGVSLCDHQGASDVRVRKEVLVVRLCSPTSAAVAMMHSCLRLLTSTLGGSCQLAAGGRNPKSRAVLTFVPPAPVEAAPPAIEAMMLQLCFVFAPYTINQK